MFCFLLSNLWSVKFGGSLGCPFRFPCSSSEKTIPILKRIMRDRINVYLVFKDDRLWRLIILGFLFFNILGLFLIWKISNSLILSFLNNAISFVSWKDLVSLFKYIIVFLLSRGFIFVSVIKILLACLHCLSNFFI